MPVTDPAKRPGHHLPRLAPLLGVLALAACQPGPVTAPAERAAPAEVPAPLPLAVQDPLACWAQARVAAADGGAEDRLFAVPCPGAMDADLMAALQRALAVRGLYAGPVSGNYDAETAEAVRRYQAPLGLDSPVLSLDAARHLGLLPVPRDPG